MTGKPFAPPSPAWNILKRLGQLADGYDSDWNRTDAGRISSPVQRVAPRADYCIGRNTDRPAGPEDRSLHPAPIGVAADDSGEEEVWA